MNKPDEMILDKMKKYGFIFFILVVGTLLLLGTGSLLSITGNTNK
jgi:hypothetical protein